MLPKSQTDMPDKRKKYLFMVQGEGRGHMTQALSLQKILTAANHEVCCVLVGKSNRREIPAFFREKIQAPVLCLESPNFIVDAKNKGVRLFPSIWHNLKKLPVFLKNLKEINKAVQLYSPDVVVNFYEPLGGLYFLLYRPQIPFVCIGHQYLLMHRNFLFPPKSGLDKWLLQMNTRITMFRADKLLGLSFRHLPPDKNPKLVVTPPLLRKEILSLTPELQPYYLMYLLNTGYIEEVIAWHAKNTNVRIHCFSDSKDMADGHQVHGTLTFHAINDALFLEYLKNCSGYISTAGFESICEAMYLDKPVMMVPVHGHFEQECNAVDACHAGAGMWSKNFRLEDFLSYLPRHRAPGAEFQKWARSAEKIFLEELSLNKI